MADFYISQAGAGTKDGSSVSNAIDYPSVLAGTHYPPLVAGVDVLYVIGNLQKRFLVETQLSGTAGNIQIVDFETYGGSVDATPEGNNPALQYQSGVEYVEVRGGIFASSNAFYQTVMNPAVNYCGLVNATVSAYVGVSDTIRLRATTTNMTGNYFDNVTTINSDKTTDNRAIKFWIGTTPGETGTYRNCSVTNCILDGGIHFTPQQAEQSMWIDNRFPSGWTITGNTFVDTKANPISVNYSLPTPPSIIANNVLDANGAYDYGYSNHIQTLYDRGLTIEGNRITNILNGAYISDGNGIILDWDVETSKYSEGIVCRRNICSDATSGSQTAGISNFAAEDSLIYANECTANTMGFKVVDGLYFNTWNMSNISVANPTVITAADTGGVPYDNQEVQTGDTISIAGVSGNTPDINSTYTATRISATTFSIPVETTSAGTGGVVTLRKRMTACTLVNNTAVDNVTAGVFMRGGADGDVVVKGCILANSTYGIHRNSAALALPTETYNCFYNNSTSDLDDNGTPVTIDATSISADPQFVDGANKDYNLLPTSPCIGIGPPKWWGTDPRPLSLSDEPLPDQNIDIGGYQSSHHANHPVRL